MLNHDTKTPKDDTFGTLDGLSGILVPKIIGGEVQMFTEILYKVGGFIKSQSKTYFLDTGGSMCQESFGFQ